MRKFSCINKKLGRLQTKVAGNWATYCISWNTVRDKILLQTLQITVDIGGGWIELFYFA